MLFFRKLAPAVVVAWLFSYQVTAKAGIEVTINHVGLAEKKLRYTDDVYLSDVLVKVQLDDSVCVGAASLVRVSEQELQSRWKHSLLYDLQALEHVAALDNDPAREEWFRGLYDLVSSQPVTGRVLGQNLNLYSFISWSLKDRVLQHGDRLNFPACGNRLSYVDGGVRGISYDPVRTLNSYSTELSVRHWQEAGYIWVVYPDGEFRKTKVGYWQHKHEYTGSRAWLFRPVAASWLKGINPNFNFELARWLATQVDIDE